MNKHLPQYLTIGEDLCWILLRTIQWGCAGALLLAFGFLMAGCIDIAIEHGTMRPGVLYTIANESRQDVLLSLYRVGTVGKYSLGGIVITFLMEQLLMVKAYLRVLVARSKDYGEPE